MRVHQLLDNEVNYVKELIEKYLIKPLKHEVRLNTV
jgi:hypothetical protein